MLGTFSDVALGTYRTQISQFFQYHQKASDREMSQEAMLCNIQYHQQASERYISLEAKGKQCVSFLI